MPRARPPAMTLPRSPDAFEIERQHDGTSVYLVVSGELDLCSAPLLREAHAREPRDCEFLVVDLSGVTFMDSSGLHALIDISKADPDRLRIITSEPVSRVIDICKLRTALPIVEG
jgi:anti-anti-sigma factor